MVQAILNNDTDICHISKIINAMKTKLRHLAGKAFLSLILISGLSTPISAQNLISNGDFETWEGISTDTGLDKGTPAGWTSQTGDGNLTLYRTGTPHKGNYSVFARNTSGNVSRMFTPTLQPLSAGKMYKLTFYTRGKGTLANITLTENGENSFIEGVLDEVINLFPSPIIHIGGDEVKYDHWKASSAITQYMEKNKIKNPAELQIDFTNKISRMLSQKGKRMIGWNDITGDKIHNFQAEDETGSSAQLAPGTIVQFWKGDSTLIRKTLEKGFDIVNSYHIYTYLDYTYKKTPLEKAYSFSPIPENIPAELKKHILGLGCQMWTEWLPTCESAQKMIFPRIAAHAETGWTAPESKNFTRFSNALQGLLKHWDKVGIKYGDFK